MRDFITPDWAIALERSGWNRFESIWELPHEWVEPPNLRRGGWGAVARHEIERPDGHRGGVFVKLHRNQLSRSPAHLLRGKPTLAREFATLQRCTSLGIGCPRPIYFGVRRVDGETRAILATQELEDCRALPDWIRELEAGGGGSPALRRRTIEQVATLLRKLHDAGFKVNSFTPNHIFVRALTDDVAADPAQPEVSLIDLERIKPTLRSGRARVHDLATLQRATQRSPRDRVRFLRAYLGIGKLNPESRTLWHRVDARVTKRQQVRDPAARSR